uniref:Uncharacterized protein n=1 Tax=Caenorhabditis japonica TaxID=281687 RepID=A0A8R1I8V8_CAEJA
MPNKTASEANPVDMINNNIGMFDTRLRYRLNFSGIVVAKTLSTAIIAAKKLLISRKLEPVNPRTNDISIGIDSGNRTVGIKIM